MKTTLCYLWLGLSLCAGQPDTIIRPIYRLHRVAELTGSVGFLGASYAGFRALDRVASFTAEDVAKLDPTRINAFDRPGAYLNPGRFDHAGRRSDQFLNLALASPLLLLADRRVRRHGPDLLTLYAMAHAVNNMAYFAATFSIRRARPLTYNPALPMEARIGQAKSNSFYSGHVSFSATATFFAAKVFTDYHHIRGWERIGLFAVAAVPPAVVGLYRMQAGKHFRTDVLTGLAVGAATGIVVPELHRLRRTQPTGDLRPYVSLSGGSSLTYTYRF